MNREYVKHNAAHISQEVTTWGLENFQSYPWRETDHGWLALAGEVMLQRTRVSSVMPVWTAFCERFPDLESAALADVVEFRSILRPLGLTWRTDLLKKLLQTLYEHGEVPVTKEGLLALPGVGDYIASAFMSLHASKRDVIVDANIVRWICRMTGDAYDGETRRQNWLIDLADSLTPARVFRDYNYGVLDLTMNLCSRNPECSECPVREYCSHGNSRS